MKLHGNASLDWGSLRPCLGDTTGSPGDEARSAEPS